MRLPFLRNYFNSVKPNFVGGGKYERWFPLFDAIENFIFSTSTKTAVSYTHLTLPTKRIV